MIKLPPDASDTPGFVPDVEEATLVLQKRNPFPFDSGIVYNDKEHLYAYFIGAHGKYVSKHVCGTTSIIGKYQNEFVRGGFETHATLKKWHRIHYAWSNAASPKAKKLVLQEWDKSLQEFLPLEFWDAMGSFLENEKVVDDVGSLFLNFMGPYLRNPLICRVLTPAQSKYFFSEQDVAVFEKWDMNGRDPKEYVTSLCGNKNFLKFISFGLNIRVEDVSRFWDSLTTQGTILHRQIELYYNGCPDEHNSRDWTYFKQFEKDHPHLQIVRTEMNVGFPNLRVCGQMDLLYYNTLTGEYIIVDIKRTKNVGVNKGHSSSTDMLGIWSSFPDSYVMGYTIQQNMYLQELTHMCKLFNMTPLKVAALWLLVIHPINPSYEKVVLKIFDKDSEEQSCMEKMFDAREKEIEDLLKADGHVAAVVN